MTPFTPELWLRVLSFLVWGFVVVATLRSKNIHGRWPPFLYVKVTALVVFGWRAWILWIAVEPSSENFDVTRIFVHAVQPAMYVALGIALVIAARSPLPPPITFDTGEVPVVEAEPDAL